RAAADSRVRDAAAGIDEVTQIAMLGPRLATPGPQQVAALIGVQLPWVSPPWRDVDLHIQRGDRIGVRGSNGSGKSTLLRVLAGERAPLAGEVKRAATTALLDQTLSSLPAQDSALQLLQRANPQADDATLRTQLALLGLDAERSLRPLATLSGGERVKAALGAVLYAQTPPQLLLLDEPGNHLDLASLTALEQMLNQYRGSVVIVSHDQALLDAVQLTHLLDAGEGGWQLHRL
ncbi:MAG: ATP-binding cassette domain-containing protein, partial [Stenotrophomonas sp.]